MLKDGPAILKIKDRVIAMLWKFIGIQCSKCESWRVEKIPDTGNGIKAECIDCNNVMNVKQPFKCPNCDIVFYEEDLMPFIHDMKRIEKENEKHSNDPDYVSDKISCPQCEEIFTPLILNYIKS